MEWNKESTWWVESLTSINSISTLVPSNATADKATSFCDIGIHRNPKGEHFKRIGESQICPVTFYSFFNRDNLWIYFSLKWWKINYMTQIPFRNYQTHSNLLHGFSILHKNIYIYIWCYNNTVYQFQKLSFWYNMTYWSLQLKSGGGVGWGGGGGCGDFQQYF